MSFTDVNGGSGGDTALVRHGAAQALGRSRGRRPVGSRRRRAALVGGAIAVVTAAMIGLPPGAGWLITLAVVIACGFAVRREVGSAGGPREAGRGAPARGAALRDVLRGHGGAREALPESTEGQGGLAGPSERARRRRRSDGRAVEALEDSAAARLSLAPSLDSIAARVVLVGGAIRGRASDEAMWAEVEALRAELDGRLRRGPRAS